MATIFYLPYIFKIAIKASALKLRNIDYPFTPMHLLMHVFMALIKHPLR